MYPFDNITDIFWDLDHTLWDYPLNARLTIFELFDTYHLQNMTDAGPDKFHLTYCRHNDLAWEDYRKGLIDKNTLRNRRFRNTFLELKMDPSPWHQLFEEEFVKICPTKGHLMPGALEVLHRFQGLYSQHIITNGFKETQSRKLEYAGIQHFFKTLTYSEETGFQKPHPEIFEAALNKASAKPHQSMMIGDNMDVDILGAHPLGMKCVFYNPDKVKMDAIAADILEINALSQLLTRG